MSERVYLNELGIICSLGWGKEPVAAALMTDEALSHAKIAVNVGHAVPFAEVPSLLPEVPISLARFASRNLQLALAALEELNDGVCAAIDMYGRDRVAVVVGSSTSGISVGEDILRGQEAAGGEVFPIDYDFLQQEIGSVSESIAAHFELHTPAITPSTACTSGAKALSVARRLIRFGLADAVIAGGCDSRCELTLNGFSALAALCRESCLPFSANRDGTMLGEGAALFLLSRRPIGPELAGIGESSDAHNMTAPEPGGRGAIEAMRRALADAGIRGGDLSYVNLHGTATRMNDAMESVAILSVVGPDVPCSSSKPQLGHTLGAAGAVEAGLCWLVLEGYGNGRLPPHIWDGVADPDAPLPGRVGSADRLRSARGNFLMSNSFAFGGSNASIVLRESNG